MGKVIQLPTRFICLPINSVMFPIKMCPGVGFQVCALRETERQQGSGDFRVLCNVYRAMGDISHATAISIVHGYARIPLPHLG